MIGLESTNGTQANGEAIPTSGYYELRATDGEFARRCNHRCLTADRSSSDKI